MTDHLPECPCNDKSAHPDGCLCCEVSSPCTCAALRSCEQRVANKIAALLVEGIDWQDGFAAGLTAAREAVDGLDKYTHGQISAADALAAIDAIRGTT